MNKILFVSSAIIASFVFGQPAFSETNLQLNKADILATSQDYILSDVTERPKARRSVLFARILANQKATNPTLATLSNDTDRPKARRSVLFAHISNNQ